MNPKLKLAITFFALCQLMVLTMDKLQGTSLYKQLLRNLSNRLMKECEKEIHKLYGALDEVTEQYFHQTTEMLETLVQIIETKDLDVFMLFLKEYVKDEVKIIDSSKHQKIIKQLDTA
jgi:hypothetical protein